MSTYQRHSIVIVGAGISGLSTAFAIRNQCTKRNLPLPELHIVEGQDHAGGTIQSHRNTGFLCESGPAGFITNSPPTLALCEQLGIADRLIDADDAISNRYLLRNGTLCELPRNPAALLRSPLLSQPGKLRLLAGPLVKKARREADESIASFAKRCFGDEAEQLFDAMQTGIYAGDSTQLSMQSCFPKIKALGENPKELVKALAAFRKRNTAQPGLSATRSRRKTTLVSFRDGMQTLTDALAENLKAHLHLGQSVTAVERHPEMSHFVVQTRNGLSLRADQLVLACPSMTASHLLASINPMLSDELRQIHYAPLAVVCLGYRREHVAHPLHGFGFLVPKTETCNLLGVLWVSSVFPVHAPSQHVLFRVIVGGARMPHWVDASDDALCNLAERELSSIVGIHGPMQMTQLYRYHHAIPQYIVGHATRLERIEALRTKTPGLVLTGNAYYGIGVNDCIREAERIASNIVDNRVDNRIA